MGNILGEIKTKDDLTITNKFGNLFANASTQSVLDSEIGRAHV